MPSVICTLFENHYHYGLVALTNSLYHVGYRGNIYAGYRGPLPLWASGAKENPLLQWKNGRTLEVAVGLQLHFLPLDTDYQLTNYKPDFMLQLWNGPAKDAKRMFYFDPDIIIVRSWPHFDEWVTCGVALCEDVNSPLSKQHPRRVAWRRYFNEKGMVLNFKNEIYVNGGFIGLSVENRSFLEDWKNIQDTLAPLIGGLNTSIFKPIASLREAGGPFMPFYKTDQDALNAAVEACELEISFMRKEGMGFDTGFVMMRHALGVTKPWEWKTFRQFWKGQPPRKVDQAFWKRANGPVKAFAPKVIFWRKIAIPLTMWMGRFYQKI